MGVQENVSERNKLMWEVLYTLHMRRTDRLMNDKVREMINGNREWEACNQVTDRIERMYPGADL